jgi:DNA integrity scanning protein DisA with diadenylate cyclase activity
MATDAKKMDFAAELAIGKPNSLGNTLSVVKAVESNPKLFSQLLKLLLHEDSIVAMRAMNATKRLMRADKDFFDPQKEALVKSYSKSKHNVVRLGLITLYFDFVKDFSVTELKSIKALTLKWMNETEDWMILAQGLKLLEKLAKIDPKVQPELVKVAKVLQKDSRKAVSTKAKNVLSGL